MLKRNSNGSLPSVCFSSKLGLATTPRKGARHTAVVLLLTLTCCFFYLRYLSAQQDLGVFSTRVQSLAKQICNLSFANLDPWFPDMKQYINDTLTVNCSYSQHPAVVIRNSKLYWNISVTSQLGITRCTYRYIYGQAVYKPYNRDNAVVYGPERVLPPTLEWDDPDAVILTEDFVYAECYDSTGTVKSSDYLAHVSNTTVTKINKDLSNVRKSQYSVFVIGVDSLSQRSAWRTLPRTMHYLQTKRNVTVLRGHHKVGINSFPNTLAFLAGVSLMKLKRDKNLFRHPLSFVNLLDQIRFVWQDYKKQGYVTALAEDNAGMAQLSGTTAGFFKKPVDLYLRPFVLAIEKYPFKQNRKGRNGVCVKHLSIDRIITQWTEELAEKLHDVPLFAFHWLTELSHENVFLPPELDSVILSLFHTLERSKIMQKSFVFFMGDHGLRMGPFRSTAEGTREDMMPLLAISTPDNFPHLHSEAYAALSRNSQRLTSHYDLWRTLQHIAARNWCGEGTDGVGPTSLFTELPRHRSCQQAGIPAHFCTCNYGKRVSSNSSQTLAAASTALKFINAKIREHGTLRDYCQPLVLGSVVLASQGTAGNGATQGYMFLTFVTLPNRARWEGAFLSDAGGWRVEGDLSRLDWYSPQVTCLRGKHKFVEKFCLCKNLL